MLDEKQEKEEKPRFELVMIERDKQGRKTSGKKVFSSDSGQAIATFYNMNR